MIAAAILVSFASTAYLFRGLYAGIYIGEIFDTRLMIVLHEHWFRFFSGKTSFLDAGFFYPYPRSFALTDTFFLTGITHSGLRSLGVELIDSWVISQFLWILIGLLGWYCLARKFIKNKFLQLLTIPLIATSFPFVAHLNERPNVVPYLLSSWVFVFLFNFYSATTKNKIAMNLGLFLVSIPLIVLTSWYAGFFIVVYLIFILVISIGIKAEYLKLAINKMKLLNYYVLFFFIIVSGLLTLLWAYIYLPELNNSANNARSVDESIARSPSFSSLFNETALGGNTVFRFFDFKVENALKEVIGLNPFAFISLVALIAILLIYKKDWFSKNERLFILVAFFSGIIIELIIFKFNENTSIFNLLFDQVAFLRSIRSPVRWHIYLAFLTIFLILFLIDRVLKKKRGPTSLLLIFIPLVILVDQQRVAPGLWSKKDFLSSELMAYQGQLENCDGFILDRPQTGMWLDIIESMALTVFLDVPSVLGYSGSRPKNYPPLSWYSDGDLPAVGAWLEQNNTHAKICFLDGINFSDVDNFNSNEVKFTLGSGFTGWESTDKNSWAWSVWQSSSFLIQNFKSVPIEINTSFIIEIPACLNNSDFQLLVQESQFETSLEGIRKKAIQFPLSLKPWERVQIFVSKDPGYCKIQGDPRDLYFSIKDVVLDISDGTQLRPGTYE